MTTPNKILKRKVKKLSHETRFWRKIHHYLGLILAVLLFISALTGIILAWKKDVDIIQPPTQKGAGKSLDEWMPLAQLESISNAHVATHLEEQITLDRIDVRPDKGIAKVLYQPGYWEVQIDGKSGEVLSLEKRYSDLVEQIHDGSIISDLFKLVSMNLLGFGLVVMIFTGVWLWYGPWKIRKIKRN